MDATSAESVPERSTKASRELTTVIIALVLLVIILSATTADLFLQSNAKPQSHLSSPAIVPLLGTQDLSSIVGGNWTSLTHSSFNRSNPTGFTETGILQRERQWPNFGVTVTVNGFNSSLYSQFAYQNFQLEPFALTSFTWALPNATVGLLAPSENYTIWGWGCRGATGNLPPGCYALGGIAVSTLYVVRVFMTGAGGGYERMPSTAANVTTVKNLLGAQVALIKSTPH